MVSYDFYLNAYKGSVIAPEDWDALERDASAKLTHYKRKYTVTAPEETSEAMAVCAMAEIMDMFVAALSGEGAMQSASIGSVSVNYGNPSQAMDLSPRGREKELYRAASAYLTIYRGVG